ncbi:MAG: peroxidase-related enzyme [Zoogloeaceae bacterium]|nr:peroxidase-related enzyme [Zoogloeaceae bacterium]
MPRIATPATIQDAPAAAQPLLEAIQKQLGVVPNLFRLVSNSPAALEGYLGLSGALAKGRLPAPTRERIALAVAQINGCDYCLAAHTYLGKNLAKLDEAEIAANRHGRSSDPKAQAAVAFAVQVTRQRGRVTAGDVEAVRAAGYDDAQIVEIVLHVALNTWTNYINLVGGTALDFPAARALQAA